MTVGRFTSVWLVLGCSGPSVEPPRAFPAQLVSVGADGTGSGEPCAYDEASCPTDCDGNTAPWLGEPVVIVDGFAGVRSIPSGATVQVAYPFRDDEDNLRCGGYAGEVALPEAQQTESGSLCSNHPASSEASQLYIGWSFTVGSEVAVRTSLRLTDACGASSDRWAWEATVPTPAGEDVPVPVLEQPGD